MNSIEERLSALEEKVERLMRLLTDKPTTEKTAIRSSLEGALGQFDIPDIPALDYPVSQTDIQPNPIREFFNLPSLHMHDEIQAPRDVHDFVEEEDRPIIEYVKTCAIEGMPHILRKLDVVWGFKECHNFFNQLIVQEAPSDNRQSRQGFAPEVMSELLFLQRLAEIVSPADRGVETWGFSKRG